MVADYDKKENREFFNKKLLFKATGVVFLIVVFALAVADFRIYKKRQELISQISALKNQIESLKNSSQNLENEIANSGSPDYLEKLAYEQLGQQKPGEKEIIFVSPQEKSRTDVNSKNFWQQLADKLSDFWNLIKSKF